MKLSVFVAFALGAFSFTGLAQEKPNILYIMSDDHAAHSIGCYGGRLAKLDPTPNIDRRGGGRAAEELFRDELDLHAESSDDHDGAYSHLTGCYGFAVGLPGERQTLANEMNRLGYETAVVGKWHLKEEPTPFSYYAVLPGQGSYSNPISACVATGVGQRVRSEWRNTDNVHSSDAITDLSLKWLKGRKKKDQPFFLMHHFKGPHDNFENAERYDWLYEGRGHPEPESLWDRGTHGPKGVSSTARPWGREHPPQHGRSHVRR